MIESAAFRPNVSYALLEHQLFYLGAAHRAVGVDGSLQLYNHLGSETYYQVLEQSSPCMLRYNLEVLLVDVIADHMLVH